MNWSVNPGHAARIALAICGAGLAVGFGPAGKARAGSLDAVPAAVGLRSPVVPDSPPLPPGTRDPDLERRWSLRDAPYGESVVEAVGNTDEGDSLEVEYTVVPELEERIRALAAEASIDLAHVIVMDPETGRVLAYVSTDPARFPGTRAYPMASLMKVVTASAVLRHQPEAIHRACRFQGSPYRLGPAQLEAPEGPSHSQSFVRALAVSNNQCFARLAVHDLGKEELRTELETTGVLHAPATGHVAGRAFDPRSPLRLGQLGSGLAGSSITPLGAARLASLLAHGNLVQPHWVALTRSTQKGIESIIEPPAPARAWPEDTAARLRTMLVAVTEEGTARRAFHDRKGRPLLGSVAVAGKTGTRSGRNPPGRYRWFMGVAPAEKPSVAIAAVVVDQDGRAAGASELSARVLREIFCRGSECRTQFGADLVERSQERIAVARHQVEVREARERVRAREEKRRVAFQRALDTAAKHEVRALDETPRPVERKPFDLSRRLRSRNVDGRIVLLLDLDERGEVLDVAVASSTLPDYEDAITRSVRQWTFTSPTSAGKPVKATARFPVSIRLNAGSKP